MMDHKRKIEERIYAFWDQYGVKVVDENAIEMYLSVLDEQLCETYDNEQIAFSINAFACMGHKDIISMARLDDLDEIFEEMSIYYGGVTMDSVEGLMKLVIDRAFNYAQSSDLVEHFKQTIVEDEMVADFFTIVREKQVVNFMLTSTIKRDDLKAALEAAVTAIGAGFKVVEDIFFEVVAMHIDEQELRTSVRTNTLMAMALESHFEKKDNYQISFKKVGPLDENHFAPDDHYTSFAAIYRGMHEQDFRDEGEINDFIDKYNNGGLEQRLALGRPDDEYAAMMLYDLPRSEGIAGAKSILKSNPNNIEAKILLAGWEHNMETRITILEEACHRSNLTFDYNQIAKHKVWWAASETRPYMRALETLAHSLDLAFYVDDAIDQYIEILDLNAADNQGIRFVLMDCAIENNNLSVAKEVLKRYPDEDSISFSFVKALVTFLKYGKSSKAKKVIMHTGLSDLFLTEHIINLDLSWHMHTFYDQDYDEAKERDVAASQVGLIDLLQSYGSFVKYLRKLMLELQTNASRLN